MSSFITVHPMSLPQFCCLISSILVTKLQGALLNNIFWSTNTALACLSASSFLLYHWILLIIISFQIIFYYYQISSVRKVFFFSYFAASTCCLGPFFKHPRWRRGHVHQAHHFARSTQVRVDLNERPIGNPLSSHHHLFWWVRGYRKYFAASPWSRHYPKHIELL